MYARYKKQRVNGRDHFQFVEQVSLFGCNEGFIPWLLSKQIPPSQGEPYKWQLGVQSELAKTEYQGSTLVIDLKPKQNKTNLSLYEVLDVWGYSDNEWTPILVHLSGLFVDVDPKAIDRNDFLIEDKKREEPIYEFLYLVGGVSNGKLAGKWITPPASPTNAALLWPQTLKYFVDCIRQRTPGILA
jgi:hypothetical protein